MNNEWLKNNNKGWVILPNPIDEVYHIGKNVIVSSDDSGWPEYPTTQEGFEGFRVSMKLFDCIRLVLYDNQYPKNMLICAVELDGYIRSIVPYEYLIYKRCKTTGFADLERVCYKSAREIHANNVIFDSNGTHDGLMNGIYHLRSLRKRWVGKELSDVEFVSGVLGILKGMEIYIEHHSKNDWCHKALMRIYNDVSVFG